MIIFQYLENISIKHLLLARNLRGLFESGRISPTFN